MCKDYLILHCYMWLILSICSHPSQVAVFDIQAPNKSRLIERRLIFKKNFLFYYVYNVLSVYMKGL